MDGKADISLTLEQLNRLDPTGSLRDYISLFVQANVTEAATGVVLQGNSTVPVKSQRYELEFLSVSSENFFPGFNYKAYVCRNLLKFDFLTSPAKMPGHQI